MEEVQEQCDFVSAQHQLERLRGDASRQGQEWLVRQGWLGIHDLWGPLDLPSLRQR